MNPQEKYLYHQIHPAKLLTDWITGVISLYFFWRHDVLAALAIALVPPVVASFLLIKFANLEKQRASRFGHYVQRHMPRSIEALRLLGYVAMAVGAWYHAPWVLIAGLIMILGAWLNGLLHRGTSRIGSS
jgi:hypothetical protein